MLKGPSLPKDTVLPPPPLNGTVLVIETTQSLAPFLSGSPGAKVVFARFEALDATLMASIKPDCVVAPLFSAEVDVLDIAEELVVLGYEGRFLAVSPPLPNPRLIKAEVRAIGPKLTFDILELPEADKVPPVTPSSA